MSALKMILAGGVTAAALMSAAPASAQYYPGYGNPGYGYGGNVVGGFSGRVIAGLVASVADWRMAFIVLGLLNVAGAAVTWKWLPAERNFVPHTIVELDERVRTDRGAKNLARAEFPELGGS